MTRLERPSPLAVLALVVFALAIATHAGSAQTPEQRYADWATPVFPLDEYEGRRDAFLDRVVNQGGGLLLIPSADGATHGGTFRQLDDFSYFTGLELPRSMLVFDGDRRRVLLFLPARDARFENAGRVNDFPGRPLGDDADLVAMAGVDEVFDVDQLPEALSRWVAEGRTLRVNAGRPGPMAASTPPWFGGLGPIEALVLRITTDHPNATLRNAFDLVALTRMIKRPVEIVMMRQAADATTAAIAETAAAIRPGVDERTLQGIFEAACRRHGAQAIPFTPIIKSGANSLWPWRVLAAHYDRRNRTLEPGDLVIQDVGCERDGYISDVGRTFPVDGRFTDIQREKLLVSTRAADAIIEAARPGVTLQELTAIAYEAIPDSEEPFMQTSSYFGHHIGLSSGDPALSDIPLAPGMIFTVEPWYYNHRIGVSVFVEDVILITEDGAEVLTRSLPRTPEELERMVG